MQRTDCRPGLEEGGSVKARLLIKKPQNQQTSLFSFICNFTQNAQKCIITGKENQQNVFPLGEEQEGKKVKPPTCALVETI